MIYKERIDKQLSELNITKENSLFLSHCTFAFDEGDIYVECSNRMKTWIVREGFIGVVEKTYALADDICIAPKGDFGFAYLDEYNLSLNGIIFNGMQEVEYFLNWFDEMCQL